MGDEHGSSRVLVVLGNARLNGQERGNIEVFYAAKEVGVDALFVTHEGWGHHFIQPALDERGLRWTTLDYARHFTKRLPLRGWIQNVGRLLKASWRFGRIARAYRPTHIHVANPHYFLSVLPALLLLRTPVVFRLGDVPTQHHALYRILWRWFVIPRVSRFVCVSEYVRDRLLESGAPPHKARVIYSHPPERPSTVAPVQLPPFEGRTVAYVGQIAPHKGVDLFVKTAVMLCGERDDVRFLIAGALHRQNAFALALLAHVRASGLSERIRFLDYVEDIPALLTQVDVHACPSVCEEALSNTVLEAKRAGVPSIVFPSGGLPEVVESGVDGWVCPEASVECLEATLREVLSMDEAALAAANAAARASLPGLGITREAFARAWGEVYGAVSPEERVRAEVAA